MLIGQRDKARSANIHIRVSPEKRHLIDCAAALVGKSRTDFILDAVTRSAEDALLDQRVFILDPILWKEFNNLLDAPPETNEALKNLLATKAPWELT